MAPWYTTWMMKTRTSLRLPADTLATVVMYADYECLSQNEWLTRLIDREIADLQQDRAYMAGLREWHAGKLEQLDKP